MSESQIVVADIGGERYGLDIARVFEIIRFEPLTALPQAPAWVRGVINLRGRIVPVVDVARRFGLVGQAVSKSSRIVVAEMAGMRVGLIVDGVSEVLMVPEDAIEASPEVAGSAESGFIRGIAKLDDRLVILPDLDLLFDGQRAWLAEAA